MALFNYINVNLKLSNILYLTLNNRKNLGRSKVGLKFSITKKTSKKRLRVKVGNSIVYLEEPDGKIVLRAISYEQLLKTARK